ncbi:unnamed protein product [Rotaria socialis]|uniref:Uncharacterized protein n=1 Tax=Rotaria socialis TaxID=392032 RepID=A0A818M217_9BILA|nr:unnamed protein product [Rotaria socialis]CAF3585560.1 unnamed protein product [Rotaria socialis]CAF3684175.1 unnamed protein product [Rotaria socialis]CAF4364811.1 unnamed protein product [Rotaria socialis]CAF4500702.1 unnamed protein product [Rotaria socialis]
MLSSKEVEELVRNSITKKFDSTVSQYARFWDVAPLMIDSLMAYIVRGANLPVEGVHPYKAIHLNQLTMIFRFRCSSQEIAEEILKKIIEDEYEIDVSFYFVDFKQVSMNLVSISSDQLRSVLSKTVADGGNTNAQYIHRQQTFAFVGRYLTNVRKMIYMENENANMSMLTTSLGDQFSSLMEQDKNKNHF